MRTAGLLLALMLPLAACRDTGSGAGKQAPAATPPGAPGGTVVISVGSDADALIPGLAISTVGAQVSEQLFEHLADPPASLSTFGDEGFTGVLASGWQWAPDSLSIAFRIAPGAHWQDGRPVTARDVRFTFELYRDPRFGSAVAPLLANIDSVTVRDPATAVFWYRRRSPEQFFDAATQLYILPAHRLSGMSAAAIRSSDFARRPVGSGPFRLVRWVRGSRIELAADTTYHRGRPRLDRVIWTIAPDPTTAATRLFTGEADFLEQLGQADLQRVAKRPDLRAIRYPSLTYGFVVFNGREPGSRSRPHPLFGNRELRRALTMAVDRPLLVRSVLDSLALPLLGPFTRAQASADTTVAQIPFDLEQARRTLDSLGWRDANGDGVRERGGTPLRFTLLVPSSSAARRGMAVVLQAMLARAGARMEISEVEPGRFLERQRTRRFDALFVTWSVDPSPGTVRQMWSTAASRSPGGSNSGGYESRDFDILVDSAVTALNPAAARLYYRRAYATINADAPAIWLYELVNYAGIQQRVVTPGLTSYPWWASIPRWTIAPGQRIARDTLGLPPADP